MMNMSIRFYKRKDDFFLGDGRDVIAKRYIFFSICAFMNEYIDGPFGVHDMRYFERNNSVEDGSQNS